MIAISRDDLRSVFDEDFYRGNHADVADAIAQGTLASGWRHFSEFGHAEGRRGFRLDPDFYLGSYPLARQELGDGLARDAHDHYAALGRARGYLPYADAVRPDNAALSPQRFGGLWPDAPNARDLIAGKRDIGMITDAEARLLTHWIERGYVVIEGAIPDSLLEPALAALDEAYEGRIADLLFECTSISTARVSWRPDLNDRPAKALDLHWVSGATRDLVFAPAILRFLGILFDSKPLRLAKPRLSARIGAKLPSGQRLRPLHGRPPVRRDLDRARGRHDRRRRTDVHARQSSPGRFPLCRSL